MNPVAEEFKELLLKSTEKYTKGYEEIALLLSGGVDSLSILFSLRELDKKVYPYTFYLEGYTSPDLKQSRKVSQIYNLPLVEVEVPRENIKEDIIKLAKDYKCKTKVSFETNLHLLYTFPEIKQEIVATGLVSGTLWGTAKSVILKFRDDKEGFDNDRIHCYYDFRDKVQLDIFEKQYNLKVVNPYFNENLFNFSLRYDWHFLNKPFQKWIIVNAFPEEFKKTGIRKESPYQLNSGMARYCETFLTDKEFNPNNRSRMLDVYRDIAKKYGEG